MATQNFWLFYFIIQALAFSNEDDGLQLFALIVIKLMKDVLDNSYEAQE